MTQPSGTSAPSDPSDPTDPTDPTDEPHRVGWSWVITTPEQARAALADPGDALDLRVLAEPSPTWSDLGFEPLTPDNPASAELLRPLDVTLVDVAATRALGARLAAAVRPGDLIVLSGPLGAGKTALTQGLGQALGVRGAVTSPTFVLARRHDGPVPLVHVDAYRLQTPDGRLDWDDLLDLDLDIEDAVTVVEWGAGLAHEHAGARLEVTLLRAIGRQGVGTAVGDLEADTSPRRAQICAQGHRWSTVHVH